MNRSFYYCYGWWWREMTHMPTGGVNHLNGHIIGRNGKLYERTYKEHFTDTKGLVYDGKLSYNDR